MPTRAQTQQRPPRQTREQIAASVQALKETATYADAKAQAAHAQELLKHESSALRSKQITEQDLSVRINER